MGRIGPTEIIIIAVLLIVIFGWKRLPDAARSLGRSARVFKSEVDELKKDGKSGSEPSEASRSTVQGDVVDQEAARRDAEARLAEAERQAAEARAEADRLRASGASGTTDSSSDIRRDTTL